MLTHRITGRPETIETFKGEISDALQAAIAQRTPLLVHIAPFTDDRGWSFMNLFQRVMTPEGQVNLSVQYPGVIKAWHRHEHQTDLWLCTSGHVRLGVYDQDAPRAWHTVMGERAPYIAVIPAGLWHGASTVGPALATILYYVTRAYQPSQPDEERMPHDAVMGFEWVLPPR